MKGAEFILQEGKIPLYTVEPYGPTYEAMLEKLADEEGIQIVKCGSPLEVVSIVRKLTYGLIICHVTDDSDIVTKAITMLKLLGAQIRSKMVRVLMTCTFDPELIAAQANLLGCSELSIGTVNPRALSFKVIRNIRLIEQALKEASSDAGGKGESATTVVRASHRTPIFADTSAQAESRLFEWVDELGLPEDIWLFGEHTPRKLRDLWIVSLSGPMPTEGRWVESKEQPGWWEWRYSKSSVRGRTSSACWVFAAEDKASKPEYQDGAWIFSGLNPWLGWIDEGQSHGFKFETGETGKLQLARDSESAKSMLEEFDQKRSARRSGGSIRAVDSVNHSVIWTDPLELESDCFIIGKEEPKRLAGRWVIHMRGPGPIVGKWIRVHSDVDEDNEYWAFELNDPDDTTFISEAGNWMFRGLAPKFEKERWLFAGSSPELAFYYEGEAYGVRLALGEDSSLYIAKDSVKAKEKEPSIAKTSTAKVTIKSSAKEKAIKAAATAATEDGKFEREAEINRPTHYRGKTRTEKHESRGTFLFEGDETEPSEGVSPSHQAGEPEQQDEPNLDLYVETSTASAEGTEDFVDEISESELRDAPEPQVETQVSSTSRARTKALLSPLGLSFIAAEIVSLRELTALARIRRFRDYVQTSCLSKSVEFWTTEGGLWSNTLGHTSHWENKIQEVATAWRGQPSGFRVMRVRMEEKGKTRELIVAPVHSIDEKSIIGLVAIESGKDGTISDMFLESTAVASRGLITSFLTKPVD